MTNDTLKVLGTLNFKITDKDGKVTQDVTVKNLVVSAGLNLIANRLKDNVSAAPTHIAVGTNATAASSGQTALVTEIARSALTSATVTNNAILYVASFAAGTGTGTLVEAGIFNDPTTGTMLSRTASINVIKSATDTLTISWTITVS